MASLPPLPEELKFINPFLQRAQETRKKEPVISYYCNYWAAKLALERGTKSKESKSFIVKLLDILEKEKKENADNEAITNDMAGEAYIENFALKVFTMADNEDRAGKATRVTAKTFLAASLYIELLRIFGGNISPEFEDKIKYAKWKAIDIMKALKEGRAPVPGPPAPGGEPELQQLGPEENDQNVLNINQFPSASASSGSAATTTATTVTGPPPPSDNGQFPLFPSAPNNNSVPNVQDLTSSFEQIDIKQAAPPLPPKVNDYAGNNNNILDNQFNQQPPASTFSPPPGTNFYDINQNYQQPPHPSTQPPSSLTHTNFTNDYTQPTQSHYQPLPPPPPHNSHNSFLPPPQVPPPQQINPLPHQQPSLSAPASIHQQYGIPSYSQPPAEIDMTTVATVQKYCKFASSALDYSDIKTAVEYMNKAIDTLKPYHK